MKAKLKIGRIPYLNLFPIFYELEHQGPLRNYEFIQGFPSELNRLLRNEEIDVSPSSSIEYLRDRDNYIFIDGHSISSIGPVESILLFSRLPIHQLQGNEVFVTHQSETSPVLLNILLKKFYDISVSLKVTTLPIEKAIFKHSAYLSIGDEALVTQGRAKDINPDNRIYTIDHLTFYIYDLGDLWFRHTGTPFVFALWIAKKRTMEEKKELFKRFKNDLNTAKKNAVKNLPKITKESGLKHTLGEKRLISYWRGISYDLNDEHRRGLELFRVYAEELRLLKYS